MADAPTYSVVIPVFNSRDIVAATVADVVAFFEGRGEAFEVVLVNDGGQDGSWEVIRGLAQDDPRIVAVRFLRNYGQHNANLAGFAEARGTWIVTMDDDGQNPASEIAALVEKAEAGDHDVVFGRFDRKKSSLSRTVGTRLIGAMNRRIFGKPKDLVVSNFRLLHRDVVERIVGSGNTYPYITGQALLYSASPGNAEVRHLPRAGGQSTYSLRKIVSLVLRIMFSYSPAPLQLMAGLGAVVAIGSFSIGRHLPRPRPGGRVPGGGVDDGDRPPRLPERCGHRHALDAGGVHGPDLAPGHRPPLVPRRGPRGWPGLTAWARPSSSGLSAVARRAWPRPWNGTPRSPSPSPGARSRSSSCGPARPPTSMPTWPATTPRSAPRSACAARRAPATSSPTWPAPRSPKRSPPLTSWWSCGTRSTGPCRTTGSRARRGWRPSPSRRRWTPTAESRPWDRAAISVSPYRYLSRGRYTVDLGRWQQAFGDAVHVVILEDLLAEPERFNELEVALGLDPGPAFEPLDRENAGEGEVTLDDGTRARLAAWFADANADLAERLGRPIDRWAHV